MTEKLIYSHKKGWIRFVLFYHLCVLWQTHLSNPMAHVLTCSHQILIKSCGNRWKISNALRYYIDKIYHINYSLRYFYDDRNNVHFYICSFRYNKRHWHMPHKNSYSTQSRRVAYEDIIGVNIILYSNLFLNNIYKILYFLICMTYINFCSIFIGH